MTVEAEQFLRDLAAEFPHLRPLLAEHETYYDELLPHLFLSEVVDQLADRASAGTEELDAVLDFFDQAYRRDEGDVQELLYVSFLEDLPRGSYIWPRLGPILYEAGRDLWNITGEDVDSYPAASREPRSV